MRYAGLAGGGTLADCSTNFGLVSISFLPLPAATGVAGVLGAGGNDVAEDAEVRPGSRCRHLSAYTHISGPWLW